MQGIYGAAAANALAAQSSMAVHPFGSHPGSMVDRNFSGASSSGGVNPFAARASLTSHLTSQHFAFLRNQFNNENNSLDSSSDFQKQMQQAIGFQRLLPSVSNYPPPFHPNLTRMSYYMSNTQDQEIQDKSENSFHRSASRSSNSSDRSGQGSPSVPKSPSAISISPSDSRISANKSPVEKQTAECTSYPGFPIPSNPFNVTGAFPAPPSLLPSLVASGSFFRPYSLPSNINQAGSDHSLMRPLGHVNPAPFIGPLNVPPRVPVSPNCLRR